MVNINAIQKRQQALVLKSFYEAIDSVKSQAVISEIARLINLGNVEGIVTLLNIDPVSFRPLESSIFNAYETGGKTAAAQIGVIPVASGTLAARFDIRSPSAERFINDLSSRKIVEISEDLRFTVRSILNAAMVKGQAPRSTALDLVGRIDPTTRKRIGGHIGLTEQQAQWVQNARFELENLDANYLNRKLRDRRFDKSFIKAMRDGKKYKNTDAAVTRMQARALRYRAENIARTESLQALSEGHFEAIKQAVNVGEVSDVLKFWDATGDIRTRPEHSEAENRSKKGIPLDAPFFVGGEAMQRPRQLGASGSNVINCRCRLKTKIDFIGRAAKEIKGFG